MKRFEKVKQLLEEAVEGKTIAAHGNFWRGITLDAFKVKKVFGKLLVTPGNSGESNLIKALEGRNPFGSNIGTPGAIFNQMPDGFPAMQQQKIDYIRKWIDDGCPDDEEPVVIDLARHNNYWREFDNWAMYNATPEVRNAIGEFFEAADKWIEFARDPSQLPAWIGAISEATTRAAIALLAGRTLETAHAHYGEPIRLDDILESYEYFGANLLPDDPLRPVDPRHNMNGRSMWFFYSAFADANLRTSSAPQTGEWETIGRAVLIGLLNDGLFRGRFNVTGFTPDDAGRQAVRYHVRSISRDDLQAELPRRLVESGIG